MGCQSQRATDADQENFQPCIRPGPRVGAFVVALGGDEPGVVSAFDLWSDIAGSGAGESIAAMLTRLLTYLLRTEAGAAQSFNMIRS